MALTEEEKRRAHELVEQRRKELGLTDDSVPKTDPAVESQPDHAKQNTAARVEICGDMEVIVIDHRDKGDTIPLQADLIDPLPDQSSDADLSPPAPANLTLFQRAMVTDYPEVKPHELQMVVFGGLFSATQIRPKEIYENAYNGYRVRIIPSAHGRPADYDRRFVMWLTSQINAIQLNGDHENIYLVFKPAHFLEWIGTSTGGSSYSNVRQTLEVLETTSYHTNYDLTSSYLPIESDDDRDALKRGPKAKTSGIRLRPESTSKGTVDKGSFRLIENHWWLGKKDVGEGVKEEIVERYNDYAMIKLNIQVFLNLTNRHARQPSHSTIHLLSTPAVRALTQIARFYLFSGPKIRALSEELVFNLCQWQTDDEKTLTLKRKRLRKLLLEEQPLPRIAVWYGPRPVRTGKARSVDQAEYMFFFANDPDGKLSQAWLNVKIHGKRNDIPKEIIEFYKSAI